MNLALLLILVSLSACAVFDNDGIYVHGNTACVGSCEKFAPVVQELHSMTEAICRAGAMSKECGR